MPIRDVKIFHRHGRQFIPSLKNVVLPATFRGRPVISGNIDPVEIVMVAALCPVQAIDPSFGSIDLGKCVFCKECEFALPQKIKFTNDFRLATNVRERLVIKPGKDEPVQIDALKVNKVIKDYFKNALKLRQVSAGGDNSAEMELNAAGNVNFDMGRYGIEFVASPRHADGLVITGPLSQNMSRALQITFDAIPDPKIIVLCGTDAISGGIFSNSKALNRDFIEKYPVDLYIPGNPPHPLTFIHGIMELCGRKMK